MTFTKKWREFFCFFFFFWEVKNLEPSHCLHSSHYFIQLVDFFFFWLQRCKWSLSKFWEVQKSTSGTNDPDFAIRMILGYPLLPSSLPKLSPHTITKTAFGELFPRAIVTELKVIYRASCCPDNANISMYSTTQLLKVQGHHSTKVHFKIIPVENPRLILHVRMCQLLPRTTWLEITWHSGLLGSCLDMNTLSVFSPKLNPCENRLFNIRNWSLKDLAWLLSPCGVSST